MWNETRAAGLHNFIQPGSSLNSTNFLKCVFRKDRDVQILPRAGRVLGVGKPSRVTLHGPANSTCADVFVTHPAIAEMTRVRAASALFRDPMTPRPNTQRTSPCTIPEARFPEDTDPLPEAVSGNRTCDSLVHESHQTRATHIPGEQIRNVKACRQDDLVCPAVQSTASSDMPPQRSELILP
jgi:hypothetical protein